MRQTCSGTTVDPSPSDTGKCSSAVQRAVPGHEASLQIRNPDLSRSDKCYFTYTLKKGFGKSDHSEFTARGELNDSIYSALRANDNFCKRTKNHFNKNIFVYGQEAIKGYINLGMPLKCLPKGSKLELSAVKRKGSQKKYDQILRHYENPSIECILFHVMAIGRTTKRIVNNMALHQKSSTLCIYALKGETVREALCKDGRFRSDLDEFEWKLIENHTIFHTKQSTVEEVAGKLLEIDIPRKPPARKHSPQKIKQEDENATGEVSPYDVMPSQIQVHKTEKDGECEHVEQDREKVLPPQRLGHDIEGKKRRTIFRIKSYYSKSCKSKRGKRISHVRERPRLGMECAVNWDIQAEATGHWLKNCQMLDKVIMQQHPNFSEDAHWMRNYFREEQKRSKLSPFQQFGIYEKCFGKLTNNSTSVATYELRANLSKSVGFVRWNNNGMKGNATCFVYNDGYVFTCRHVVLFVVGEGTDPRLWPHIISKCARVTFTYKTFCPPDEEFFSFEPWLHMSGEGPDYAILKLRENGHGFPPGLVGQVSSLPPSGLICLIGHPEGRTKEIDECAVITVKERLGRYSQLHQHEVAVAGLQAATLDVCSMFTPRSFPPEAYSTDRLSYDTCFTSGSSGSPVFNADGKVVAMHSFGQFYKRGNKVRAIIEFGYSIDSILYDLKQRDEPFYTLLHRENGKNLNQGENNKKESSLQDDQREPMEH